MMGRLLSGLGWTAAAGTVAALAFARYRSNETGKDIVTVLGNLPEELQEAQSEWRRRLQKALAEGREAAAERELRFERELEGEAPSEGKEAAPEYMV